MDVKDALMHREGLKNQISAVNHTLDEKCFFLINYFMSATWCIS